MDKCKLHPEFGEQELELKFALPCPGQHCSRPQELMAVFLVQGTSLCFGLTVVLLVGTLLYSNRQKNVKIQEELRVFISTQNHHRVQPGSRCFLLTGGSLLHTCVPSCSDTW